MTRDPRLSLTLCLAVLCGAGLWMGSPACGAESPLSGTALPPLAGPELGGSLLRMGAALAGVLGVMVLAVYALRRFGGGRFGAIGGNRLIRMVASQYLGGKSQVSVVEVDGKRYLLGVSPERITLLCALDRSDTKQMPRSFPLEEASLEANLQSQRGT